MKAFGTSEEPNFGFSHRKLQAAMTLTHCLALPGLHVMQHLSKFGLLFWLSVYRCYFVAFITYSEKYPSGKYLASGFVAHCMATSIISDSYAFCDVRVAFPGHYFQICESAVTKRLKADCANAR